MKYVTLCEKEYFKKNTPLYGRPKIGRSFILVCQFKSGRMICPYSDVCACYRRILSLSLFPLTQNLHCSGVICTYFFLFFFVLSHDYRLSGESRMFIHEHPRGNMVVLSFDDKLNISPAFASKPGTYMRFPDLSQVFCNYKTNLIVEDLHQIRIGKGKKCKGIIARCFQGEESILEV